MASPSKRGEGSDGAAQKRARLLNRIIFGVALFGVLLTVHLWIQSERDFSHGCFGFGDPDDVGAVECSAVTQSDAGKLFGISNIVYGFFFFATVAALSFASVLARSEAAEKLRKISLLIASAGVIYALYLFSYQVFVLGQFCKLCLTTGFTTAVLFGLHAMEWAGKAVARFELAGLVREIGLFILMTLVASLLLVAEVFFVNHIGTLAVSGDSADPAIANSSPLDSTPAQEPLSSNDGSDLDPAAAAPEAVQAQLDNFCRYDDTMAPISNVAGFTRGAPFVGSDSAEVAIVEFFDPNCPHCKTLFELTPTIMAQIGGRARLYYRPYPIWPYSYTQVEALYLAQDQGLFEEMLALQMERQQRGGLSIAELVEIADAVGMDTGQFRRDLNAGKYRSRVNREKVQIGRLGINSVPKLAINGRFVQGGSLNPACLDHMVEGVALGG